MKSAQINTENIVINTATGQAAGYVACPDEVSIGWMYNPDRDRFNAPAPPPAPPPLSVTEQRSDAQEAVRTQAERRKDEGLTVAGIGQFQAKDSDLTRLMALLNVARLHDAAEEPILLNWRTAAGASVTLASLAEIKALVRAVNGHLAHILTRSAVLQAQIEAMDAIALGNFDPTLDSHWSTI